MLHTSFFPLAIRHLDCEIAIKMRDFIFYRRFSLLATMDVWIDKRNNLSVSTHYVNVLIFHNLATKNKCDQDNNFDSRNDVLRNSRSTLLFFVILSSWLITSSETPLCVFLLLPRTRQPEDKKKSENSLENQKAGRWVDNSRILMWMGLYNPYTEIRRFFWTAFLMCSTKNNV